MYIQTIRLIEYYQAKHQPTNSYDSPQYRIRWMLLKSHLQRLFISVAVYILQNRQDIFSSFHALLCVTEIKLALMSDGCY